jgi:hypothetical protein
MAVEELDMWQVEVLLCRRVGKMIEQVIGQFGPMME